MSTTNKIDSSHSKSLPIGIENFSHIRENNFYYVDKTHIIEKLTLDSHTQKKVPRYYFLSRPRRFGKSLLLDTIQCLFEGKKDLFKGLHIYDKWDWSEKHPVIRITFGGGGCESLADVEKIIHKHLNKTKEKYELPLNKHYDISSVNTKKNTIVDHILCFLSKKWLRKKISPTDISIELDRVITALKNKTKKKVVVLIDEYDMPILEVLQDSSKAMEHCNYLRGLYGTLKVCQENIHFILITGISMFSKVNLFSKINHLNDISMISEFSTICGYTATDLKTVFAPEMIPYDLEKVQRWYDGYTWDLRGESERVFCPYSVLQLFLEQDFGNSWYEECMPQYLYKLMKSKGIKSVNISNREVNRSILKRFDAAKPNIDTLLFQNGYLTIRAFQNNQGETKLRLVYPNLEVAQSMSREYLEHLLGGLLSEKVASSGSEIVNLLSSLDAPRLQEKLHQVLSGVHYNTFSRLRFFDYESSYAGLLYMLFVSHCSYVSMEEGSSHGRSDMVIGHNDQVFVLELKCVLSWTHNPENIAQAALRQIENRGYADKHKRAGVSVHAVAMVFGKLERNILNISLKELT